MAHEMGSIVGYALEERR